MNNRFNYNKLIKNHFFGFLIILFIHLPLIILGENSYIHVSDNLSLDHLFHHLLKKFNHLFCLNPNHEIESILNGIKTSTFHSSFSLINIFYIFLPSFWAYVLNSIVVKTVGFYGTYWLVNEFSKIKNKTIFFFISTFLLNNSSFYNLWYLNLRVTSSFYGFFFISKKFKSVFKFCNYYILYFLQSLFFSWSVYYFFNNHFWNFKFQKIRFILLERAFRFYPFKFNI